MFKVSAFILFSMMIINAFHMPHHNLIQQFLQRSIERSVQNQTPKVFNFLEHAMRMKKSKKQQSGTIEMVVLEETPIRSAYDKCLDQLEVIMNNIVEMARMCTEGHWQDTLPLMGKTVELFIEDVKCFQSPQVLRTDPMCIYTTLQKGAAQWNKIVKEFNSQDWEAVKSDVQVLIAILSEIQNC